ncbi:MULTISPECIES: VanW family protein [Selenomonas]|uniref:Vanomycin resistance protein VanB n=1 Tax=Selenomonas ruminis TaxID=2593411 RepID=A0A5D6W3U0_9FIRM|nr:MULTISPECIES: VanW family protein [unclassified Selenomonas]MBQ1867620.1 VanW family protein [Selenomonas sp.]TYZ22556.1 vanomycin resistance protein VanB [Selenomonas sp. mPRGC5]
MNFSSISTNKAIALGIVGLAFTAAAVSCISVSTANQDCVVMGVQSNGTSLTGMSKKEVRKYFDQEAKKALSKNAAVLSYKDRSWNIQPNEIGLQAKVDEAAEEAYNIGREGNTVTNLINQMKLAIFGKNVVMTASFDKDKLNAKLSAIEKDVDTPPENAEVSLQANGSIQKKPAVTGLTLDTAPVAEELAPKFEALELTAKVELEPKEDKPFILDEDIANIDAVLGSYTTRFYPGDRGDNIGLAASHLQGALIRSQATLSFNNIVGQRTRAAGYKNAGVIVNGEPAVDVGGGVCQVSSTLYNAILLAGLKPTERSNHSLPSSYVPAGRDATVADGLLDFVFQNPLPHPVVLRVSNSGSALTIYVLGTKADLGGKTISLVSEGPSTRPSVYRIWKQDGKVVEREFLHTDTF